jgi:hypothetical protein
VSVADYTEELQLAIQFSHSTRNLFVVAPKFLLIDHYKWLANCRLERWSPLQKLNYLTVSRHSSYAETVSPHLDWPYMDWIAIIKIRVFLRDKFSFMTFLDAQRMPLMRKSQAPGTRITMLVFSRHFKLQQNTKDKI